MYAILYTALIPTMAVVLNLFQSLLTLMETEHMPKFK